MSSDGMADQPSTSQSIPSCGASSDIELQSQPNAAEVENVEITNEIYAEISPVPANFDPLYSNTADGEQTNIPSLYGEVSQIPQGCELCENMRGSCRRIMDSFYLMAKRSANYEEIKEENSNLRRQLGDTNKFVEDRLKDVFSLQTELSTLRVDAGLAKQREEDLLKQIQILEAKAKESREHAHAANVWREKYSRSVEVAEQLQEKRLEIDKKLREVIEIASSNKKKKEDFEHQTETLKKEKKELTLYNGQSKKALPKLFQLLDEIVNESESLNLPLLLTKKIEKVRTMSSRAFLLNLKEHSDTGSDDDANELESLLNHSAISASTSTKRDDSFSNQSFTISNDSPKPFSSSSTFVNQDAINASARKSHYGSSHAKTPKFKHTPRPEFDKTPVAHTQSKYLPPTPVALSSQPENKPSSIVNTIHGKKGKTVREIQEEQRFKGSVKERVAEMKRLKELEKNRGDNNHECTSSPNVSSATTFPSSTTHGLKEPPNSTQKASVSRNYTDDLDFEDIGLGYSSQLENESLDSSFTRADITIGDLNTLADDLNMSVSDVGSAGDAQEIQERTDEEVVESIIEDMLNEVERLGCYNKSYDVSITSKSPKKIFTHSSPLVSRELSTHPTSQIIETGNKTEISKSNGNYGSKRGLKSDKAKDSCVFNTASTIKEDQPDIQEKSSVRQFSNMAAQSRSPKKSDKAPYPQLNKSEFDDPMLRIKQSVPATTLKKPVEKDSGSPASNSTLECDTVAKQIEQSGISSEPQTVQKPSPDSTGTSMIDMLLSFNDTVPVEPPKKRMETSQKLPITRSEQEPLSQKKPDSSSSTKESPPSLSSDSSQNSKTIKSKWADGAKRALDIMNRINQELQPVLDSIPLSPKMKQSFESSVTIDSLEPSSLPTSSDSALNKKKVQTERERCEDIDEIMEEKEKSEPVAPRRVLRKSTALQQTPKTTPRVSAATSASNRTRSSSRTRKPQPVKELVEFEDESIAARLRRRAVLSIVEPQKIIAVPNPSTVPNTKTGESLLRTKKQEEKKVEANLTKPSEPRVINKNQSHTEVPDDIFSGLRKNTRTRVTASKKVDPTTSKEDKSNITMPTSVSAPETVQEPIRSVCIDTDEDDDLEIADLSSSGQEQDQLVCSTTTTNEEIQNDITSEAIEPESSDHDEKKHEEIVSENEVSAVRDSQPSTSPVNVSDHMEEVDTKEDLEKSTALTVEGGTESHGTSISCSATPANETVFSSESTDEDEGGLTLDIDDEKEKEEVDERPKAPEIVKPPEESLPVTARTRQSSVLQKKKEENSKLASPKKRVGSHPSARVPIPTVPRPKKKALDVSVASTSTDEDTIKQALASAKKSGRPTKIYDISRLNKFTQSLGRGGRLLSSRSKKVSNPTTSKEKKTNVRESILVDSPKTPVVRQTSDRKGLKRVNVPSAIPIAKRGKRSQDLMVERSESDSAKQFFLNAGLYLINMKTSKDNAVSSVIETYLSEEQLAAIKQLSVEDLGNVLVEIVYNMKNVDLFHQVKLSFLERSIKEIRNKEEEHVLELAYVLANGNIFISFVRSLVQKIITQETINPNQCASYARLMSHALLFDCSNVEEGLRASKEERLQLVRAFFNTIFWKHKACISHALIFWLIGNSWELLTFLADDLTLKKLIVIHVEKYERDIIQWAWSSRFGEASAKSIIPDDVVSKIEDWIAEEKMNMEELIPSETAFTTEEDHIEICPEVAKSLRMQAVLYNSTNLPPDLNDKHLSECSSLFQEALNDLITSLSTADTSALFADTTNTRGRSLTVVKVHELCITIKSFESIIGHSLLERESTKYRRSLDVVSRTLNNIRFIRNTLREDPDIPFSKLLSSVINTYVTLAQTFTSHTI